MVKVQLAVYDLSRGMAMMMSQQILGQRIDGIWHTGIVVNGTEYYYGGGVQRSPFGTFAAQSQLNPVRLDDMGETTKTQHEIDTFLRSIRSNFTAQTYDLLNNNCNHFSNALCIFLTGHGIPVDIVDLPRIVFSTPGGQMLRPMIEGMQQNINQQRGTMDPFGGLGATPSPPPAAAFEQNLVSQVQTTIAASSGTLPPPAPAVLDDKSLLSNDNSNVTVLGGKLLNLAGSDGVKGSLLPEFEKLTLNQFIAAIAAPNVDLRTLQYSADAFNLFLKLLSTQSTAQLSCLFLLRLMVLSEKAPVADVEAVVDLVLAKLASTTDGFASAPSKVMAICVLANVFGCDLFATTLLSKPDAISKFLDAALSGLSNERVEMRQMCSALASNVSVYLSKHFNIAAPDDAIQAGMIQLLLACIENLDGESEVLVRKRKLTILCRVVRRLGQTAVALATDLDVLSTLEALSTKSLDALESGIVSEVKFTLLSAQ